ncbi:hypothetical protein [Nonlabens xiamenensis]|uniref:hypothetical protein n=1 Tax=Nonlabens xiamenensis TaxID=2341043 RepID=UPI000F60E15B|nr:hypothetical protein [Nonlabens xiamenensis]
MHFFTNYYQIQNQISSDAFGIMPSTATHDRFKLDNHFDVSVNAPVYSICKSIVFYVESQTNSDILNCVLFPFGKSFYAGLPLNCFVIKGIDKSSLVDTNNEIKLATSQWKDDNILELIKKIQDKINVEEGINEVATSDSLGIQFSNSNDTSLVESVVFDHTDDFKPVIVNEGCQIGLFKGGSQKVSIQCILNTIGHELDFAQAKSQSNILEVPKLPTLSGNEFVDKNSLYSHRVEKEKILGYIDITAFFGNSLLRNGIVNGLDKNNWQSKFSNKNKLYLDIRNEHGLAFNHFLINNKTIQIGAIDPNDGNLVFNDLNYSNNWPLIILDNQDFIKGSELFIRSWIDVGLPFHHTLLTTFNNNVKSQNSSYGERYSLLGLLNDDGTTKVGFSEVISLRGEDVSNSGKFFTSHYLMKIENTQKSSNNILPRYFSSFFNFKMRLSRDLSNIDYQTFYVKLYSGLNAPAILNSRLDRIYDLSIGLAIDKNSRTFFTVKEHEKDISNTSGVFTRPPSIATGKFTLTTNTDDFNSAPLNLSTAFLYGLKRFENFKEYRIGKKIIDNPDLTSNGTNFLHFERIAQYENSDLNFLDAFNSFTLDHSEYSIFVSAIENYSSSANYHLSGPIFLEGKIKKINNTVTSKIVDIELTATAPSQASSDNSEINLSTLTDLIPSSNSITLRANFII